ncbi:MAG: protein kinase [Myxococcota bacterium]
MTAALEGRVIGERYRVVGEIARGGMSVVLRAVQLNIERDVAIKILRRERLDSDEAIAQFLNEARAVSQLKSPHTVTLFDVGEMPDNRGAFLVMELLDGPTLREHLTATASVDLAECARIVLEIATSIAEAHARGIVHRDLKPSNVMLAHTPGHEAFVKVLDFGLADDASPAAVSVGGTPAYLAPELIAGSRPTPRSDVYALGILAYELLEGRRPFDGEDREDVLRAHLEEVAPPLRRPGLPSAVKTLVARCLAKTPRLRPPDASTLRDLWQRAWSYEPPSERSAPRLALTLGETHAQAVAPEATRRSTPKTELVDPEAGRVIGHGGAGLAADGHFYWWRGEPRLTVIAKAHFRIVPFHGLEALVDPPIIRREAAHRDDNPTSSLAAPDDWAPYRPFVDVTVAGRSAASEVALHLRRGDEMLLRKVVHVDGAPPADVAWEAAPVGPHNPYGGTSPRLSTVAPHLACFGPVIQFAPSRRRLLQQGIERDPQGRLLVPTAIDWRFFQQAPPEQWFARIESGDQFELLGWREQEPHLRFSVPGHKLDLHVRRATGERAVTIQPWLDQIHIDCLTMTVALTYRSVITLAEIPAEVQLCATQAGELPQWDRGSAPPMSGVEEVAWLVHETVQREPATREEASVPFRIPPSRGRAPMRADVPGAPWSPHVLPRTEAPRRHRTSAMKRRDDDEP